MDMIEGPDAAETGPPADAEVAYSKGGGDRSATMGESKPSGDMVLAFVAKILPLHASLVFREVLSSSVVRRRFFLNEMRSYYHKRGSIPDNDSPCCRRSHFLPYADTNTLIREAPGQKCGF